MMQCRGGRQGNTAAENRDGAPEKIRTSGLQLRRLPLYPAELRAHILYQNGTGTGIPTIPTVS